MEQSISTQAKAMIAELPQGGDLWPHLVDGGDVGENGLLQFMVVVLLWWFPNFAGQLYCVGCDLWPYLYYCGYITENWLDSS